MKATLLATAIRDNGSFIDKTDDVIFVWAKGQWLVIDPETQRVDTYPSIAVIRTTEDGDKELRRNCVGHFLGDGWAVHPCEARELRKHHRVEVLAQSPDPTTHPDALQAKTWERLGSLPYCIALGCYDIGVATLEDGRTVYVSWGANLTREQQNHWRKVATFELVHLGADAGECEFILPEGSLLNELLDILR